MFLGTHTPRLDDKGRLALPARFRPDLEGGLVICKGQDRCLYVFPVTEFSRVTEALRSAPVTDRRVRDYSRVLFASASHETPDGQGRITVPTDAARVRGPRQGLRGHRRQHPHRGLGHRRLAGLPRRHRARRSPTSPRRCCPECSECLDPRLCRTTRMTPATQLPASSRHSTWHHFPGARRDGRGPEPASRPDSPPLPTPFTRKRASMDDGHDGRRPGAADPAHVPVLLDRVLALLAPALPTARPWPWTRRSGSAATPRRCSPRTRS